MTTIDKPDIVALVPMRHHSERVPGKNYRNLNGKPLCTYILETLSACPELGSIAVDTDSPVIREIVEASFPAVRIIDRPAHLRDGSIPMNDVLRNDLSVVQSQYYLQTHSTNPLLSAATISRAIHRFREGLPQFDSLFSVTRRQVRLWDEHGRAINHDPAILLRTQDLAPVFEENSCLYIFSGDSFLRRNNRLGDHPQMFATDPREAYDIDEEWDFEVVEAIMRGQGKG